MEIRSLPMTARTVLINLSVLLTLFLCIEVQLECPFQGASQDMRTRKSFISHFAGYFPDLPGVVEQNLYKYSK